MPVTVPARPPALFRSHGHRRVPRGDCLWHYRLDGPLGPHRRSHRPAHGQRKGLGHAREPLRRLHESYALRQAAHAGTGAGATTQAGSGIRGEGERGRGSHTSAAGPRIGDREERAQARPEGAGRLGDDVAEIHDPAGASGRREPRERRAIPSAYGPATCLRRGVLHAPRCRGPRVLLRPSKLAHRRGRPRRSGCARRRGAGCAHAAPLFRRPPLQPRPLRPRVLRSPRRAHTLDRHVGPDRLPCDPVALPGLRRAPVAVRLCQGGPRRLRALRAIRDAHALRGGGCQERALLPHVVTGALDAGHLSGQGRTCFASRPPLDLALVSPAGGWCRGLRSSLSR
mmetsp:Transcript_4210/g.12204  ORF Transcript_4210/g.12204 Transcript_4210/m.12204 type:complete len:341 (+) Transcript_4210:214-1236(+)